MSDQFVIDIATKAVWVAMKIGAPALLSMLVTGLIVAIFQAATQINEQTLSFIPKIVVMTLALIFTGPWIMITITSFTEELYRYIPLLVR